MKPCLVAVVAAITFATPNSRALLQHLDPALDYENLMRATSMTEDGKSPFHLRLEVQMFDMQGNPSTTGIAEEWWMSSRQYRIEYTSGAIQRIEASGLESPEPSQLNRDFFLLREALTQVTRPLSPISKGDTMRQVEKTVGQYKFNCLEEFVPPSRNSYHSACRDAEPNGLRVSDNGYRMVVRERTGMFQQTQVPLVVNASYNGKQGFTAKITFLQVLRQAATDSPKLLENTSTVNNEPVHAGKLVKKVAPEYPVSMRADRKSGTVLLQALLAKDGSVADLLPLESPDKALTGAAITAVRQWRYEPFLLNGQPAQVDTVIQINFNLNP